jgi:BirA family biotin operon repressor/biotin-[acetyl-CoA-carboxylase] ligase
MTETDSLDAEQIRRALQTSAFWGEIIYREQVGSTNDVAKHLASQGAPAGTVVIADEQTAGRGRQDRRWVAPPGTSLLCSILFRPDLQPAQAHRLTMLCSMAAADAIEGLADLPVALKWPNDLVTTSRGGKATSPDWRKLAGVLTETGLAKVDVDFVVVGLGINVNVPQDTVAELAPNATSILAETGHAVSRSQLLVRSLEVVEERYERLRGGENPRYEWAARLATLGRHVRVTSTDGVLEGVAEAVDENGALLLRTQCGSLRRLMVGDVTLTRS